MDKTVEVNNVGSHQLNVLDRKNIALSGIKKIISFDNEEFLMESNMGTILLKGENLEIIRLDTHDGNVVIKGIFNGLNYLETGEKINKESFVSKLFR